MNKKTKIRKPRSRGIAETYIYIKDVPSELSASKVESYLQEHARAWAEEIFKSNVTVHISVEEGSLKVKILVGTLTLFNLVGVYGTFRTGIDYLVKDSRSFSNHVIAQFSSDENFTPDTIQRAERRLGVPGKIQRFYKSLDKLNSLDLSHNERQEKTNELKEEFLSIIELLESAEDREHFMEEIPDDIKPNPNVPLPQPIRGIISLPYNREEWT